MDAAQNISTDQLRHLKVNERALLFTIEKHGVEAVSVREAAELMHWTPFYVGQVLKSLAGKGMLQYRKYGTFRLYSLVG